MKFSVVTDMLGEESFEEAISQAKRLGFDFVELRAKLDGDTVDTISVDKAKALREVVESYGLKVATLSSWAVNSCTFSGPPKYDNYDDRHHLEMTEQLDRLFDLADAFHAPNVRIYPLHRREGFDALSTEEKEQEYTHNADVLLRHAKHAKKRGKVLLVENEPPTLANNCQELGVLMKKTQHPNLKLNWDIVNGWRSGEYPTIQAYQAIKGHVASIHLKGASREINSITDESPYGRFNNFAIAGQDDFEHEEIIQAVAEGDPQAILTIDTHYPSFYQQDKIGEVEVVRQTKEFFEKILKVRA
ncbi:sugar phosphate isomerase/epimerase family protein [Halalkalibacter krulwichiae]|uniref:Xylose isomerase-like TIM barrel n=1 Tax=Halalkalibacter krulwichiae TaxID=199441 RepID=A0A1X9MF41_9BACI|nr:sugar phosphate isomerase/epimerase [Halalkalibacter krulwichiae]ARK30141.1 Xylose isomerase-like TIM barrel [Halalkalibacter krulwichiae]